MLKKNLVITWGVRVVMYIILAHQNSEVVSTVGRYVINSASAESAVQASQLSGELILVAITELSKLILAIVMWVMVELTVKEVFRKKKVVSSEIVVEGVYK